MTDDYNFINWPKFGRLLNGVVVPCTIQEWAEFFESQRGIVEHHINGAHVSTVFIGINHGYRDRPLWFETMVFDLVMPSQAAQFQKRYETLAEAKAGHESACAWVREHIELLRAERREALTSEVPEGQTPHKAE